MRAAGTFIQLHAALDGSFEHEIAAARGNVVNALGLAMYELADELVGKLRHDFQSSGMKGAQRLSTAAWRKEVYGAGKSLEPAAWVYSKVPIIVSAFENGQTIRAKGGKGLLIPNPAVWPGGRVRFRRGQKSNMGDLWAAAEARFGPLTVVKRPGKTTLVIANVRESASRPGSFRKLSASARSKIDGGAYGKGVATIVVFVLAKEAKQERLLHSRTIKARAQRDAPRRMDQLFLKYFAAEGMGQERITNQAGPRTFSGSGFSLGGGGSGV